MKKTIPPALAMFLALSACQKQDKEVKVFKDKTLTVIRVDSNGVKKTDSSVVFMRETGGKTVTAKTEVRKYEYTYEAFDGSRAAVTFTHYPDRSYLLIERNKYKIELPQTRTDARQAVFEKEGIRAVVTGNRITLTQDGQTVELERR